MAELDTPTRILDIAERLVQTRGFNGFSYADISSELGVTKASLHYHFAGKAELGEAVIDRYAARFRERLAEIDAEVAAAPAKLEAYAQIYASVLRDHRMCLCGMLAAEYETLPAPMRAAIVRFFDESETWLVRVLEEGRADGTLRLPGPAEEEAHAIVDGLEGALLVARPLGDVDRFEATAARLLARLSAGAAA
ncbi:MAG TPA: TetR/AcrR family transcriptional regulator [Thermoleophilaceae bacterium]|nr:TetR/AcrR family transcriptional regulator [Thermoleophilaceae bacterium]